MLLGCWAHAGAGLTRRSRHRARRPNPVAHLRLGLHPEAVPHRKASRRGLATGALPPASRPCPCWRKSVPGWRNHCPRCRPAVPWARLCTISPANGTSWCATSKTAAWPSTTMPRNAPSASLSLAATTGLCPGGSRIRAASLRNGQDRGWCA